MVKWTINLLHYSRLKIMMDWSRSGKTQEECWTSSRSKNVKNLKVNWTLGLKERTTKNIFGFGA